LGSAGIALLIGLIFMVLIRYFAGVIVWFFIVAIVAIFALISGYCYVEYSNLKITVDGVKGGTVSASSAVSDS